MRSEAEEKIRFVIAVFRVVGWPLADFGLPLGPVCTLFYVSVPGNHTEAASSKTVGCCGVSRATEF